MRLRFHAPLVTAALAALGIVCSVAAAHAQGKPALAVLGLEVIDDGTGIDAQTAELARVLTRALRERARLGNSPYRLAPNSEKDLLELKLLSGCSDEARPCMAAIGRDMSAAYLMFGKVEKRDTGYQVTLRMLNVATTAMERVTTEVIPFADNNGPGITNKWSRTLYNRLTGIPEQGNLAIEASVSEGRVFVDGSFATTLRGGKARVDGLTEGRHTIAVEAPGHARFESPVDVVSGETETVVATLTPISALRADTVGAGVDGDDDRGLTRTLFWGSAVATGVSGAVWAVSGYQYLSHYEGEKNDAIKAYRDANEADSAAFDGDDVCIDVNDDAYLQNTLTPPLADLISDANIRALRDACSSGQSAADRALIFGVATGVLAVASAYLFYRGFLEEPSMGRDVARSGKRDRAPTVQVAPTITPDYFGAGVKIEF